MKHKIILSLLLLISIGASAQMEIDKMERLLLTKKDSLGAANYKWLINLSGDYYTNSNAITNSFVKTLAYNGAFVDDALKDKESNRLKKSNRLGADAYAALQGIYNGKKLTYVFGVGQRAFLGVRFPEDLFNLVFRGNASFAGQNADLSHTNVKFFDYQNFYVGAQKQLSEGKFTIGASASFLRGGNYQSLQMNNTNLYTEPTGQYVSLNGDLNYSKTSGGSFGKSHGKGASVNLFFSMKHNKNRLNFEIRDIGFITWKDVKTYSGDSTYQYNGLLVNNVLAPGASIVNNITVDSIASSIGLKIHTQNMTMALPTVFHVNYMLSPNKRLTRTIGLRYMLAPGYIPQLYIREADFLGKGFTLVNMLSYGGFGRMDYQIGVMKKFQNSFIISLNLFAFEYLVLPNKSSGNGLNFGLTKLF
ncbi:MAG TPA: DUF5723 family protein [Cytophagaceae bacterium]|jgi:hypothetical protein|nr:DUF5723 family protein [Cytophagaceae bacterium]